eukprot:CAMPEP_0181125874 /NCGR_PEP_ID=MMETSP1071-20121207/27302_1 /TAXON_ID=35127 /ORGANISM="Thalassiosira sp., Strain NH16" /LENGTH=52 /DNA_ID=CAMNT_0023211385 /DNA_START=39 /DNA_END=194 /DNA_ORIENTATION=-
MVLRRKRSIIVAADAGGAKSFREQRSLKGFRGMQRRPLSRGSNTDLYEGRCR